MALSLSSVRSMALALARRGPSSRTEIIRSLSEAKTKLSNTGADWDGGLPDSIKRVGEKSVFPNEYPGMDYQFNWSLNGDGVTPLRRLAYRICKPLDLKIAGLETPKTSPLKVTAKLDSIPEAGTDALTFDKFDDVCEQVRDRLSLCKPLYCPEGHVPGTRMGVRFITNSATLAPDLLAYLDRAPKKSPKGGMPITVYVLEGYDDEAKGAERIESFVGYSIEEIEVPLPIEPGKEPWFIGYIPKEAKSVASIVIAGQKPDLGVIAAGIELSQKALAQDEVERAAKKKEEEEQAKE